MWQLREDAGAVTGLAIVRHRAPMRMFAQGLQPHLQHAVGALAFDMGHKSNAAGIVLVTRMIEPGGGGQAKAAVQRIYSRARISMRTFNLGTMIVLQCGTPLDNDVKDRR